MHEASAEPTSESREVVINDLSSQSPTPRVYLTQPPSDVERDSTEIRRHEVLMNDARDLIDPIDRGDTAGNVTNESRLSLDLQGFEPANHETRAENL